MNYKEDSKTFFSDIIDTGLASDGRPVPGYSYLFSPYVLGTENAEILKVEVGQF